MALLLTEGFDWMQDGWNGSYVAQMGWSVNDPGRVYTAQGRYGGKALRVMMYVEARAIKTFSNTGGSEHIYCGFAGKPTYSIDGAGCTVKLGNAASAGYITCQFIGATGAISVYNVDGTLVGRSLGGYVNTEEWFYGEIYMRSSSTNGAVTVRVNGVEVISLTGIKTRGAGVTQFTDSIWLEGRTGDSYYGGGTFDDIYVCDNTPGGPSGFLGPIRIQTAFPDGAGDTTQLTPSNPAYENWQLASNPLINDSAFVYGTESTAGAYDLYTAQDIPATSVIYGVKTVSLARMSDAAPPQLVESTAIKTNGSVFFGTNKNATGSYEGVETIYANNPATSSLWTPVEVNAIQFGHKQG